ncbi:MAG: RidA family protein [Clostridiales Family XIII bacterium]|jgi:2-iminobutanoate/2-iminopropanoate deaminase|nr:RidA family protein [Clostridiales Family XIII bacterium]
MRKIITTETAPAAIGPYAQANKVNGFVFTSGQVPLDPATGEIVGTTAAEQAVRVMENLRAVLEAAGSGFDQVIKTTVFMKDMNDFAKVNEIYGSYFTDGPLPSRSAVEVARLPKDVLIEIEMIALAG